MKAKILFISLITLFPNSVFAAPSVSSVSGTITHGQTITVSGSQFGTKASGQAAPVRFDNFEDGTVGESITTSGWWQAKPPYDFKIYDNSSYDSHSIAQRSPRSQKLLRTRDCGSDHLNCGGADREGTFGRAFIGIPTTRKGYISAWVYKDYYSGNLITPSSHGQDKFFRICTPRVQSFPSQPEWYDYDENRVIAILWTGDLEHTDAMNLQATQPFQYLKPDPDDPDIRPTEKYWFNFVFEYREGSAVDVNDGAVNLYFSRTENPGPYYKASQQNQFPLQQWGGLSVDSIVFQPHLAGKFTEGTTDGEVYSYFDDIYIDNSWARVEIGDNAVYDSCTHREIQPTTVWSDTSVSLTFNQGSFDGGQAYLFVVDENGDPSSGYPITLGGVGDTTPPSAPQGLSVI